jgi:AcrR family transcriptional regulator
MHEDLIHILTKVKSLYSKYGIKSVTMDDVSRELGISKKTLYQFVKDKTELVEKIVELEIEKYGCFFETLHTKNLNAIEELFEVQKIVTKMLREHNPSQDYDLRKYYPEQFAKVQNVKRERMYENILLNLKKGKVEGLYRSEIDEEIIAKIQLLRIETSFDTEIFTMEEIMSTKVFYEIFIYHIRGIANEKGIALLEKKLKESENNNI